MACLAPAAGTRYAARIGAIPPRMVRVVDAAMSLACEQGLTSAALAARLATASGAGIAGAVAAAAHVAVPRARTTAAIGEALAGGTPLRGAALELASSKATYKDGDPRAAVLMQLFEEASPAQAAAVARAAPDDMTLEYVVAGVGWACRISSGALLAIAQAAGWIAHALEERRNPTPYRPRLAYTGPPLRATTPRRTLDAVQQYLARQ
jgi:citrate synthase